MHAVSAGGPVRGPVHGGGAAMTTMGRRLHWAPAPRWRQQGARGARDVAMGGQRGQTPDPGRPFPPLRRGTGGGWGAGGGGGRAAQPAPNP